MIGSSTRALARVGWRDIRRHRGRSILVALLILLPVAGMVAGISLYRTTQIPQERQDVARMGRADLLGFAQVESELTPFLPAGSTVERMDQVEGQIVLPGARPSVTLRAMRLDGLAEGVVNLVEGRAPSGAAEVAISRAVGTLAGVALGGQLTLEGRPPATVVGIVENPIFLPDRTVVVDPATFDPADTDYASWLIDLPADADPAAVVASTYLPDSEIQKVSLIARGPDPLSSGDNGTSGTILIMGALALVEAALIASAAFAVSIRRRQRELGLLSATGATPRQLAAGVVLESAMLGLAACIGGVIVGLLGVLALTPFLDGLTEHRNGPMVVDAVGLIGPVSVGFVAAIIAAIVPAASAARLPVLLALSGRRPSPSPARRTLWLGLGMIAGSIALTIAGANLRNVSGDNLNVYLLIGGAVLGTLGFGACSPWLLERLEGVASRLPVAGRIAFRDTARARSRSSPIATAILSSLAAVIAIGAFSATRDAESLASWRPSMHADQLLIDGAAAATVGADLLAEPGVVGGLSISHLVPAGQQLVGEIQYELPDARDADGKLINLIDNCDNCNPDAFQPYVAFNPAAATPELLELAHATAGAADLAQGRALLLTADPITATEMRISVRDIDTGDVTKTLTLPVRAIQVGVRSSYLPDAFLPDAVVRDLGLTTAEVGGDFGPAGFLVQFDHPVVEADIAHARELAARYPDTAVSTDSAPVRPGEGFRFVLIALVLLFAVSVTAIAIALGEAESRPEQRSLLALGADPGLRRRIAASRAAVLALLAGLLAVPAGLLPIWGIFTSRGSRMEIPSLEIAGAVVLLPLLAVASAWLLSRPIPDWNAFRRSGAGD